MEIKYEDLINSEKFQSELKKLIKNHMLTLKPIDEKIYEHKGLMWTKTFPEMKWEEAIKFCENLTYGGYSDWRLPGRFELESLLNLEKYNPACDIIDTIPSSYWSYTTDAIYIDHAWSVSFKRGSVSSDNKSNIYHVRAVRG